MSKKEKLIIIIFGEVISLDLTVVKQTWKRIVIPLISIEVCFDVESNSILYFCNNVFNNWFLNVEAIIFKIDKSLRNRSYFQPQQQNKIGKRMLLKNQFHQTNFIHRKNQFHQTNFIHRKIISSFLGVPHSVHTHDRSICDDMDGNFKYKVINNLTFLNFSLWIFYAKIFHVIYIINPESY